MAQDIELSLLLADYHRTHPILSGAVAAEGIKFASQQAIPARLACGRFMKNTTSPRCRSLGT